jgi:hypothetical protein
MKGKDKNYDICCGFGEKAACLGEGASFDSGYGEGGEVKGAWGDVVEASSGAWGYDVDSAEFVEGLRRSSKRLDWIE